MKVSCRTSATNEKWLDQRFETQQTADIAANMSEVRSLLGHFRSPQLVRTSAERSLLDDLLAAGGLDRAEGALLASVDSKGRLSGYWKVCPVSSTTRRKTSVPASCCSHKLSVRALIGLLKVR